MICSRKMVVTLLLVSLLLTVHGAAFKGQRGRGVTYMEDAVDPKTDITGVYGYYQNKITEVRNEGARDGDASFRKKPLRRGGCSAFGHSCFGGHGKRSDDYMAQIQSRQLQRLPPADIVRQWMKSLHNVPPLLE